MAPKDDMKIKPDKDGNWFITPKQKPQLQEKIKAHLNANRNAKDPRAGFGTVNILDPNTNEYDEKIIHNTDKYLNRDSSINLGLPSKKADLKKKATRLTKERPQVEQIKEYAFKVGDTQADVDQYLADRGKGYLDFSKENKSLNIRSAVQGGDKIEKGHIIGLNTEIPGEKGSIPPTSAYNQMQETKFENRGSGVKGGSDKSINLKIATGTVPKTWKQDYEFWRTERESRRTKTVNPLMPFNEEFHPHEKSQLLDVKAGADSVEADEVKTKIYQERDRLQKQHGIKVHSGTTKPLTSKGLFRNIMKVAGQSNNPLVNVSGDIVGAVMDGVAYAQNPNDADALADLTLSGSQALLSLGAIGLAAVPIPGARPGAYMLMKAGDKVAMVERMWNMGREGRQMASGKLPVGVNKAKSLINKQDSQNKLLGKFKLSNTNF